MKIVKQINYDYEKQRYTFSCSCLLFFIVPVTMVCDWKGSGKQKKDGEEDFMYKEYYFCGLLIWKKKHKTKTWIPK